MSVPISDNLPYEQVGKNEQVCIADEVPFDIPDTWEWVRLSSVNDLYTGNSINKTEKKKKYAGLSSGYYYIGTKDVGFDHSINYDNGVKIPYNNDSFRIAPKKSILLCIEGGSAGRKIAVTEKDVCFGNKLCCFVSFGIDYLFLYYYLQSPMFLSVFKENKTGVIGGVSLSTLKAILLPIPPLMEQKRIVSEILKYEPFVNEYEIKYNELSSLNTAFPDRLKKSILQMAVQGKLVPQDPDDEPASILLKRIRAEKERLIAEGKIKKDKNESVIYRRDNSHYEKLEFTERCIDDEIPYDLPDSWMWYRMSSLFSINPRNQLSDDTVVGFMPMPLLEDGFKNKHSFEERKWGDVKNGFTHFKNGDVVIAKITPCFQNRKSAVIVGLPNNYGAGTTELHVLRDYTNILFMPYFLLCCKTHAFISGGVANFTGTAGQQRVGKDYISKCLIPLPPIREQVRIVEAVKSIFVSLDVLL